MSDDLDEQLIDALLTMEGTSAEDSEMRTTLERFRATVPGSETESLAWEDVLFVLGHRNRAARTGAATTPAAQAAGLTKNLTIRLSEKLRNNRPHLLKVPHERSSQGSSHRLRH
jgi:hypothetical protein